MNKPALATILFFLMVAMLFGNISSASAEDIVTVYGEYLTDSSGYNYGVDYFVDSDVATQIYVAPYIRGYCRTP